MPYKMFFGDELMPQTPGKVTTKIKNQNKTLTLINGEEINLLRSAGLTEVSFDLTLPASNRPYCVTAPQAPQYYLSMLEQLKQKKEPFQWILNRSKPDGTALFHTNLTVGLEDYQITDSAGEGFDIIVTVKLKQYRAYGTKTVSLQQDGSGVTKAALQEPTRETQNAPSAQTYAVKSGDCLWNIAKRELGDGARYVEIYELNKDKIKNPNLIYPGQVLSLPARR